MKTGIVAGVVGVIVLTFSLSLGEQPPAASAELVAAAGCLTTTGTVPALTTTQAANAKNIITIGRTRGVPPRGWAVAVATAMQESGLQNLPGGDRDSLGIFQQRPSTGWGTPAQLLDPTYAVDAFYGGEGSPSPNPGLLDIPGWEAMDLSAAAQAVQRSAFPAAYAKWTALAIDQVRQVAAIELDCSKASLAGGSKTSGGAQGWYAGTSGPVTTASTTVRGTWSDTDADVQTNLYSLSGFSAWTGALDIAVGGTVLGSGENYSAAASGAYDARWKTAASILAKSRAGAKAPTFVRPWHEFNGDWYTGWAVTPANVTQYKAAWRRWAGIMRSTMPSAFLVWSPNDGNHQAIPVVDTYPGDDVVDVIAPDSYDFLPAGTSEAGVTAYINRGSPGAPAGLETWRQFAAARGKPLGIPEWGLCPVSKGCGGDHPEYITAMHAWMAANANTASWQPGQPMPAATAGKLVYSIYFDLTHGGDNGYTLAANPRAQAAYNGLKWGN